MFRTLRHGDKSKQIAVIRQRVSHGAIHAPSNKTSRFETNMVVIHCTYPQLVYISDLVWWLLFSGGRCEHPTPNVSPYQQDISRKSDPVSQ